MGVRSLNGLNGTDTSVVITNRMLATQPLEMTQPTFTDPITMSIKGLSGFGTNGQILETTGSQIQYRTAPIESNWTNDGANLYPKDGVDENVLVGATTNPNNVKFYVSNGNAEINDTLKLTGTNQELQFVSNTQNKGIHFYTNAGTSAGWKMYGVSNQNGSARLEQLGTASNFMFQLYANDASRDYYEFNRGVLDIRNNHSNIGSQYVKINFNDYLTTTHKKFQLESDLETETFKLRLNSTGNINEEEDVMTLNCDNNSLRQITFDKTMFYTINGDPSTTSDTIFKIATNANDVANGGNPAIQIQHKGLSGMSASWQLADNGDVLLGGAGDSAQKLKLYTSGGDIEFWGSQLGQTNQYGSIDATLTNFLSTDTQIQRLKLKPGTHTTTIQENGSIAGDITLTLPATSGTIATTTNVLSPVWNVANTTELIADPKEDDSNICTKLTISSGAGLNGDCLLLIRADTDNAVETSNPRIQLQQDGTFVNAFVELSDNDFLIGTNFSGSDTVLYTNSGAFAISDDSGASQNIAIITSAMADLKSTKTKAVKLETNTIEGTTTANKLESTTNGWKITTHTPTQIRTLTLDNGGGSYMPSIRVDSATNGLYPFILHIESIGDAYIIQRNSASTSQANLQHIFYGIGILTNNWTAINNQDNSINSNSTVGWEFEAAIPGQTITLKRGSYYPFIGTVSDSIPYNIAVNGITGNVFEIHNTNNQILDMSHRFYGKDVYVPKIVATYQTNNTIISESSGWIFNSNTPQTAIRIRLTAGGSSYDPNIGIKSESIPFTISCGSLSEVYNIVNTLNTEAGIEHQFKGTIVCGAFKGDSSAGNIITDDSTSFQIQSANASFVLALRPSGRSIFPYLGSPSTTVVYQIHINTISGNPYEIHNTDNTQSGFQHYLNGEEVSMCSDRASYYRDGSYVYFYNPLGTNGAHTFAGSYYAYHDNGSAIYFNLPSAGTTSGHYISFASANNQKARIDMSGQAYITGSWNGSWAGTSDSRLKENIVPIENAKDTLMKINVYQFDKYDIDNYDCIHHEEGCDTLKPFKERLSENTRFVYGFVAQELCENTPTLGKMCVKTNDWGDEEPAYIIDDRPMLACAIKTIQEQQEEINTLKEEVNTLKEEVNTYKEIIDKLLKAPSFKAFKESVA